MRSTMIFFSSLDSFVHFAISSAVLLQPTQTLSLSLQILLQGLGTNFIYVH